MICIKLTAANSFIGNFYFFMEIDRNYYFSNPLCFVYADQIFDRLYEEELLQTIKLIALDSHIINI